jgi:RNA recognition motif-containing protein
MGKGKHQMSVRLYVGNLSYTTTASDLRDEFAAIGSVESCSIVTDRVTGRSRGFGFVEMSSRAEGENAAAQLDGKQVNGRELRVSQANPKQPLESGAPISYERVGHESFQTRAYFKQAADMFGV